MKRLLVLLIVPLMLLLYTGIAQATVVAPVLSGQVVSSTEVDLSWTDAGTEDSYAVRQGNATIATLPADTLSYPVTGLSPNTTYSFEVWAKSGAKNFKSNTVTVTTLSGGSAPTVTGFTPTSGAVGTGVTVNGTGFTGATAVKFNGTSATFTVTSSTAISTSVPSGASDGTISVTTPNGTGTSSSSFNVLFPPTVTSFTPTSGIVGDPVTLTGTNFTGATAVKFNGTTATFTVNSATSISTNVPSGATTGTISVTTPDGTGTSSTNFTVSGGSSCQGVSITAGADTIQAAVDANPTGTTFCLNGTYTLTASVSPKANDSFIGTGTATTSVSSSGAVATFTGGTGVTYDSFSVGPSGSDAMKPGSSSTIQNMRIHDAQHCGITSTGNFMTIQNNEVDHNGLDAAGGSADCGIKVHGNVGVDTGHDNLITNNNVHDNHHNGIWTDCDAYNNTISNNTVTNNGNLGLDEETSYGNVWTGNTLTGNGFTESWQAAQSLDSLNSTWTDNVFSNNWGAMKVWQDSRATLTTPQTLLGCADTNNTGYIPGGITFGTSGHGNKISTIGQTGRSGIAQSTPVGSAAFDYNCWQVATLNATNWILPSDTTSTWTQWQTAGKDLHGTHQTASC